MENDEETWQVCRDYSVSEFHAAYPNLVYQVFGPYFKDGFCTEPIENGIFTNPGWKCFLLPMVVGHLDHSSFVTKGRAWRGRDGQIESDPVNWLEAIMLVHWRRPVEHVFSAMTGYFAPMYMDQDETGPVKKIIARAEAIYENPNNPPGFQNSEMLFDAAGEWGMIDCWDELFSVFGAKGDLFDDFVAVFGGMERIKQRMNQNVIREYLKEYVPGKPEASAVFEAHYKMIYSQVGWDWPFEPHFDPEKYL